MGTLKLKELKPDRVQFLYDAKVQADVGSWTVKKIHAVLQNSLNHTLRLDLISQNPNSLTTPPKPVSKEVKVFDEIQIQQMLILARGIEDRNYPLYHLAVTTGMRQGEILGLQWENIDLKRKSLQVKRQLIRVRGGGFQFAAHKTNAGKRTMSLGPETVNALKEHHEAQYQETIKVGERWQNHGLVFPSTIGTPHGSYSFTQTFQTINQSCWLTKRFVFMIYSILLLHSCSINRFQYSSCPED
jgi:integrase